MQVEAELSVERAVQQISNMEAEGEEEYPLEGLNNQESTDVYKRLTPEDRQLFRQFKKFHKLHYELYGHDVPSHQLTHGIIKKMFFGIPAKDAKVIAAVRAEIFVVEWLKSLCKQLGLAVPIELQQCQQIEAPEYPPPPSPLQFPLRQEEQKQLTWSVPQPESSEVAQDIKLDVKLPRRMTTSFLGKPGLLHKVGTGDEDHIITRVLPGTDPLQEFDEDDREDIITIDHETDDSDVDNLSEASMVSADTMMKEELQGLLANVAVSHQMIAEAVDVLAACMGDMSTDQGDQAAMAVVAEMGHIRDLNEITQAFDRAKIGLILATGVRKLHEYQCLKEKWEEADIILYSQLEKKFGANRRNIIECSQGYKYRNPKGIPTKVQFTPSKKKNKVPLQRSEKPTPKHQL